MNRKFSGIWPAMVTPLTQTGEPRYAEIERLVDLFVRQGLDGVFILGSTGQWPLLNLDQRRAVAERVVRTAAGRIPISVHVGAVATEDAMSLARHAAKIGADAISSVGPIYFPATAEVTFEHFRQIGGATELPFFVYHLAGVNQLALSPRDYANRVLQVPRIAGMKITDRDVNLLALLHAYTGNKLALFSGADEVLCHAALSGAVGAVGSFYNVWGPTCQRVRKAFVAGDFNLGRDFMLALQTVIARIVEARSIWTFMRSAMRIKYGIDIGLPKAPLGSMDKPWKDAEVEQMIATIDAFGEKDDARRSHTGVAATDETRIEHG